MKNLLFVSVCIVSLVLIILIPVVSAENYSDMTQWDSGSYTDRDLQNLNSYSVDSFGNAYVSDVSKHNIQQFSSSGSLSASPAAIDWQKTLGGSNDEVIYGGGLTILSDGSYLVVASHTQSSDGDVTGYHGGRDIWVAKLRSDRTIEWEKSLGGSGDESGNSLPTQLPDGGYLISGTTTSNDGDVSGNHGGSDIWLVKISANGTLEWQKCLGGSGVEERPSIQMFATVPGGYIISATTTSNDGDVSGNHGGRDFWLMQFNVTSRTIEWQRCLGGTKDEIGSFGNTLVENMDETDFMIMGITESNDGDVSGNHGGSDLWFLKMFQNRTIAWQKCLGGSGNETGYDASPSFASTQDGGYLLSGYTESNDGDVTGNHGGGDTWIVKLNSNRGIEWQKCIGGSASDPKWFFNQLTNTRIRIRGSTFSSDGDMTQSHGNKDYWIATLFNNGTIESVTCLGGSGDESARSAYYLPGGLETIIFTSNSTDGDVTGNHGGNDIWLASLNPDTSINWSKAYGGSSDDWGAGLGIVWGAGQYPDPDGKFIFYGYTSSNDGDVSGNHGKKDIWIVQSHLTLNNTIAADFVSDVRSGPAPLAVKFTDRSSGSPTSWSWSFGDGNTSSLQNPIHTYEFAGMFTVNLTVSNTTGGTDTLSWNNYITVFPVSTPSKIGVVRNSNTWLLDASGNGAYGSGDLAYVFGKAGDVYVTGDWNNDGRTEIGVVRNSNTWLLDASGNGAYGSGDLAYVFGKAGDVYVTGDWNDDGKTEIGVVRNNNTWLLDASGNGAYGAGDLAYVFGKAGDVFVMGDWNSDGKTEIGVVRNSNTWLLDVSGNGAFGTGDLAYVFGKAGDVYVTGDWNNDGRTKIGVVRNSNTWYLDASVDGAYGPGDYTYTFGKAGDKYITGKWS